MWRGRICERMATECPTLISNFFDSDEPFWAQTTHKTNRATYLPEFSMRDATRCLLLLCSPALFAGCGDSTVATPPSAPIDIVDQVATYSEPAAAPAAPAASATPVAPVQAQIMDEAGFGRPMVAAYARIPGDWRTRGGVAWDRSSECVANHLRFNWLAVSPDGRQAFELMPGYSWQLQGTEIPMNPCPPLAIRTTQQYLETIAQRYPGARVLGYRERPELVAPPQQTPGAHLQVSAGELRIAYRQGATEIHELLTTTLNISAVQGNIAMNTAAVFAYRVAEGTPDAAVSDRFIQSLQPEPQWMAQVKQTSSELIARIAQRQSQNIASWHASEMAKINARGNAERAQIRAQTNREVAQIYSNIWSNSQATDDRIQRRTLEGIGGYNTYADPSGGGVVRESIEYDRVLRTQDGDYLSTNDPYLNPAGSEELRRIP